MPRADQSGPHAQSRADAFPVDVVDQTTERPVSRRIPDPDERIDEPLPSLVRLALERAKSFGPVTIREVTNDVEVDLEPLAADESGQVVAVNPMARMFLFAALIVLAAILIGLVLAAML